MVAFDPLLNIQDANVPLPHMLGVADVEELFLPVQLKLVRCFRPRLPPEAINFLTLHTKDSPNRRSMDSIRLGPKCRWKWPDGNFGGLGLQPQSITVVSPLPITLSCYCEKSVSRVSS